MLMFIWIHLVILLKWVSDTVYLGQRLMFWFSNKLAGEINAARPRITLEGHKEGGAHSSKGQTPRKDVFSRQIKKKVLWEQQGGHDLFCLGREAVEECLVNVMRRRCSRWAVEWVAFFQVKEGRTHGLSEQHELHSREEHSVWYVQVAVREEYMLPWRTGRSRGDSRSQVEKRYWTGSWKALHFKSPNV